MPELTLFFTNEVVGTKLFVPLIKFKQKKVGFIKRILAEAIQVYKLSDFWIFECEGVIYALCLTPVQKERLIKILKFTLSNNLNEFLKYGRNYCPKELVFQEKIVGQRTLIGRGFIRLLNLLTVTEKYVLNRKVGKNTINFVLTKTR